MELSEFEIKKCEKALEEFMVEHRPPINNRAKVDLAYRIVKNSIEIFELRQGWQDPTKMIEFSVAKATFVKSRMLWKIYWMMADLKWHSYPPIPEVKTFDEFLKVVGEDENACFFG